VTSQPSKAPIGKVPEIEAEFASIVAKHDAPDLMVATSSSAERHPSLIAAKDESDPEWEAFPRTRETFIPALVSSDKLKADRLYRNLDLNPLDTHLPKRLRKELEDYTVRHMAGIRKLCGLLNRAAHREMSLMIEAGVAKTLFESGVSKSRAYGIVLNRNGAIEMPAVVSDPENGKRYDVFRHVEDRILGAAQADMPLSSQISDYLKFMRVDYAMNVVNWFACFAKCPEQHQKAMERRIDILLKQR